MLKKAKLLLLFFFGVFFLFFLAACTKDGSSQNGNNAGRFADRRPDFGQPERQPDVSGLVKGITGNEVTVIKLDMPERATSSNQGADDDTAGGPERTVMFGTGGGMIRSGGGNGGNTVHFGGPGGGGAMAIGGGSGERTTMLERLKEMSSGDEKIIIPVGIKMLKPDTANTDSDNPGRRQLNMVEAALIDITADKMLQVWLDPTVTDRKVAEFVMVMR